MRNINKHFNKQYFESREHIAWRGDVVAETILAFCPGTDSLVDVGCGTGDILAGIRKLKPGVYLQGIDGAIEAKKQYMGSVGTFLLRDMCKAKGVSLNYFEVCICFEVFQYIEPQYQKTFMRNLQRLSNKILISAPEELQATVRRYMVENKYHEKSVTKLREQLETIKHKPAVKGIYHNSMYFEKRV